MNKATAVLILSAIVTILAFSETCNGSPMNCLFAAAAIVMLAVNKFLPPCTPARRVLFAAAIAGIACFWGTYINFGLPFYIMMFFTAIATTATNGLLEGIIFSMICIAALIVPYMAIPESDFFIQSAYSGILLLLSVLVTGSIKRFAIDRETENHGLAFLLEFNELLSACETEDDLASTTSDFIQNKFAAASSILLATESGEMQLLNTSNLPANFSLTENNTSAQMFFTELAWRAFEKEDTVIIDQDCVKTGIPENLAEHIKDYTIFAIPMKNVHDMVGLMIIYEQCKVNGKHSPIFHSLDLIKTGTDILSKSLANIGLLRKYRRAALVDELTGLFNRRSFFSSFYEKLIKAKTNEGQLGFIIMDIDFFKSVNDAHGHKKGDQVLAKCAAIAKSCTREEDVIARIGGEEFAVILSGADEKTAWNIAERIRLSMAATDFGIGRNVTVSIGISSFPVHGESIDELFNKADTALYEVKNSSRNCVKMASV